MTLPALPGAGLIVAALLAGCAHQPPPPAAPNPFGYLKRSAICKTGPVSRTASGLLVAMKTRSDDGLCQVSVSDPGAGAYASFLLSTLPQHGSSFIYNFDNHTIVTYTAATAYAGDDSFTVSLVPADSRPRVKLQVDVAADATGVPPPPPPPPPPAPAKPVAHHHPHRAVHHHHTVTKTTTP